ncbi:unnamed protein product [Taenia asiatica]|uniref:Heat shock protein 70 family n=1 Tax=Taenia asiatica TaxID=60517 RepID=A0A0R3VVV4_TAEAS|nr:unnamed protein product [Taenia asiatica]
MPTGAAIGIDLRSTSLCVGVVKGDRIEVIASDEGNRTTSSGGAYAKCGCLTNEGAKNQSSTKPANTTSDTQRLNMTRRLLKLKKSGKISKTNLQQYGLTIRFTAMHILATVLLRMKKMAETYLGEKVESAVITVPAYFSTSRRQATISAGNLAGLNVPRIISEPTAAVVAYGMSNKLDKQCNLLVFVWGGGSFGVSITSLNKSKFEEKAFAGDAHLGGEAITSRLVNHYVEVFNRTHEGKDLRNNANAISRLRKECEIAKRSLSVALQSNIELGLVFEGITFSAILTRSRLEQLCRDLFERTMDTVKKALSDAKMEKTDVHEVVLMGGSTRIPKVRRMLQEFFEGKEVKSYENTDLAVAHGAALLAAGKTDHGSATLNAPNSTEPIRVPVGVAGDQMESLKQEDEEAKRMMAVKIDLMYYICKIKCELESEEVKQKVPEEHRKSLSAMCDRAIKWTVTEKEATKEDYDKMRTKFVDVASLLMKKGQGSS